MAEKQMRPIITVTAIGHATPWRGWRGRAGAVILALALTAAAGTAAAAANRSAAAICREAEQLADAGEYETAVARYNEAIRLAPSDTEAFLGRGNALRSLPGRHRDAIRDFDRVLVLNPRHEEALYLRALEWMMLGEKQHTIEDCSRLLRLYPAHLDALYLRANMYDVLDFPDSAAADYSRAVEMAPESERSNALMLRADFHRNRGNLELAVADFDAVLLAGPDRFPALIGRAESLRELGRHEAAVADYDACLVRWPGNTETWYGRGISKLRLQRNAEAVADFDSVLAALPIDSLALNGRGMARFQLGRDREAIADFDAALENDPNLGGAYLNRIWAGFFAGAVDTRTVFAHEERISLESNQAPYLAVAAHFWCLRAGDPRAAAALAWAGRTPDGSWPDPVLQFLAGEIPESALLDSAADTDRQTEARAYLGLAHALAGRRAEALAHLRWVLANGNREFIETSVARRAVAWLEVEREPVRPR